MVIGGYKQFSNLPILTTKTRSKQAQSYSPTTLSQVGGSPGLLISKPQFYSPLFVALARSGYFKTALSGV